MHSCLKSMVALLLVNMVRLGPGAVLSISEVDRTGAESIRTEEDRARSAVPPLAAQEPASRSHENAGAKQNPAPETMQRRDPVTIATAESHKPVIRLLGLDAVGWPVLNKLLISEKMPGFKRLLDSGVAAVFRTDVGNTAVSCTTITTGKERYKHGILNYDEAGGHNPFDYTWRAVKVARLWHMLQYHQLSVLTRGFLLADDRNQSFPTIEELQRLFDLSGYDAIITFYSETDAVMHDSLMPFMLAHSAWGREFTIDTLWVEFSRSAVARVVKVFADVDALIDKIVSAHPQDILIVFSDHGHRPCDPVVEFSLQMSEILKSHQTKKLEEDAWLIDNTLKLTFGSYKKAIKYAINSNHLKEIRGYLDIPVLNLDEVENMQPLGGQIIQELLAYREAGHQLFELDDKNNLFISEDMISFLMNKYDNLKAVNLFSKGGEHDYRDHGILIAYGPPFLKGKVTDPLSLVDLTPTVLYVEGLSVGRDMDGTVAKALFQPEFLEEHPVTYIDSYDRLVKLTTAPGERRQLSPEEIELYKRKGYPGFP